jgi:hypothetical protein
MRLQGEKQIERSFVKRPCASKRVQERSLEGAKLVR